MEWNGTRVLFRTGSRWIADSTWRVIWNSLTCACHSLHIRSRILEWYRWSILWTFLIYNFKNWNCKLHSFAMLWTHWNSEGNYIFEIAILLFQSIIYNSMLCIVFRVFGPWVKCVISSQQIYIHSGIVRSFVKRCANMPKAYACLGYRTSHVYTFPTLHIVHANRRTCCASYVFRRNARQQKAPPKHLPTKIKLSLALLPFLRLGAKLPCNWRCEQWEK